jgi:hypothetical protein
LIKWEDGIIVVPGTRQTVNEKLTVCHIKTYQLVHASSVRLVRH